MVDIENVWLGATAFFSAILIVTYGVILAKTKTKFKFIIALIIMLIISRVCQLVLTFAEFNIIQDHGKVRSWYIIAGISEALAHVFYAVSKWLFASEYYRVSIMMPLALREKNVSKRMTKTYKIVNGLILLIIILVSIATGF